MHFFPVKSHNTRQILTTQAEVNGHGNNPKKKKAPKYTKQSQKNRARFGLFLRDGESKGAYEQGLGFKFHLIGAESDESDRSGEGEEPKEELPRHGGLDLVASKGRKGSNRTIGFRTSTLGIKPE